MDVPQAAGNFGKTQWEILGEAMVRQYYTLFENAREQVVAMYSPDAMFTFEDFKAQGQLAIKDTLFEKVRFQKIQHMISKIDCQPTMDSGLMILVTGQLKADNDVRSFSQSFMVKPLNGSFFICHTIFRTICLHN